ncbi:hypothetical protein JCM12681A_18420 [Streptomyces mexicanus]
MPGGPGVRPPARSGNATERTDTGVEASMKDHPDGTVRASGPRATAVSPTDREEEPADCRSTVEGCAAGPRALRSDAGGKRAA